MMRGLALLAGAALLIGAGAPPTETDLGSRVPHPKRAEIPDRGYSAEDKGRVALREFARCTFARIPLRTAKALMLPAGDDLDAVSALATDECLFAGELQFSDALFRGALFAEMYRRRAEVGAGKWAYSIPAIDFSKVPDTYSSYVVRTNYFMLSLAECVAAKEPEAVRTIVMEPVATQAQNAAFAKVIAVLGPCVPQGTTMAFNRTSLEAAFGEFAYRSLVPVIPYRQGKPA